MCKETDSTDIIEVKKGLTTLLTDDNDIKKLLTHSISETVISTYNSSLPKAEELGELETYSPGITGEFVEMMKDNLANEIEYDKNALKLEDKRMDLISEEGKRDHNTVRLGQVIGGLVSFSLLFLAYILIDKEQYGSAIGLIGVAGALGIVASAFTGNKVNTQNNNTDTE